MNINLKRQSQFELFPKPSKNGPEPWKPSRLTKDLTLSLENIIVLCIIFVMVLVLFFSFGVERGKKIALLVPAKDEGGIVQTVKEDVVSETVQTVPQVEREERVVFPVSLPEEIREETEPAFRPPLEKTEEQENLFTIQVASFKLEKNAKKEADRLKGIGHDDTFVVPKGSYSIVCVGKFVRRNEAKKFSSKLKKRYNDCLVRRL
ncbi:MAG: SPOR domain-containing protein [Candidatus Omnitrophica bacterium]|nr:SPOR domain-containing protein [Candidatus Omnitrophota bacterium]